MGGTIKRTVTTTPEQWEKLRCLSVLVLGVENRSGMISYMTNKLEKELQK